MERHYSFNEIPFLEQQIVECNPWRFTRWLNSLRDEFNTLGKAFANLDEDFTDLEHRVCLLEAWQQQVNNRLDRMDNDITEIKNALGIINNTIHDQNVAIAAIQNLFDTLVELLPLPYGMIAAQGYKIAIGNVDFLNGYNGDTSRQYGIFTTQNLAGTAKDVYHDEKKLNDVIALANSNKTRIENLESRMDTAESNITNLQGRMTTAETNITNLTSRVNALYNKLPVSIDTMTSRNYKLAVGNINVMSANNGNASVNVGVITHDSIANNDIYFN